MKKLNWLKMKKGLQIAMGASVGIWLGCIMWDVVDYKLHPEVYTAYSAPWYIGILVTCVFWGIVLLLEIILWLIAKYKSESGSSIGVIERK